jgi:hypothetical protein
MCGRPLRQPLAPLGVTNASAALGATVNILKNSFAPS